MHGARAPGEKRPGARGGRASVKTRWVGPHKNSSPTSLHWVGPRAARLPCGSVRDQWWELKRRAEGCAKRHSVGHDSDFCKTRVLGGGWHTVGISSILIITLAAYRYARAVNGRLHIRPAHTDHTTRAKKDCATGRNWHALHASPKWVRSGPEEHPEAREPLLEVGMHALPRNPT